MDLIVLIPVYKKSNQLNSFEKGSIINTYNKFKKICSVVFFGPLKIQESYKSLFPGIEFSVFNSIYFRNIKGYNRLLKSLFFYKRFKAYSHILIVQTDAFVLGDAYEVFKFKKFHYCGAPSIVNSKRIGYNGGFSLRSVSMAIRALKQFRNYETLQEVFDRHMAFGGITKFILYKWIYLILDVCLRKKIAYPFNYFYEGNEDIFWSVEVPKVFPEFKVIDYQSSLCFSWENNCEEFYKRYPMPFGCHGWWNYNFSFWKDKIMPFLNV